MERMGGRQFMAIISLTSNEYISVSKKQEKTRKRKNDREIFFFGK